MATKAEGPTHLLAQAGVKRALCGSLDYPRLLARFKERHDEGHVRSGAPPIEWCQPCLDARETAT